VPPTPATVSTTASEYRTASSPWCAKTRSLSSPIAGIIQSNIYWLEVYNNTDVEPEACNWFWLNAAELEGNSYMMQDLSASYGPEDAVTPLSGRPDTAFCMNLANEPPPEPVRACCTCQGGGVAGDPPNCSDATFFECNVEQKQRWVFDVLECAGAGDTCGPLVDAPDNDECTGAFTLHDGLNTGLTNRCANNSTGALDVEESCDGADTRFDNDVWYRYVSTCSDSFVRFDTCEQTNGGEDLLLAVYSDNDASCPCPPTPAHRKGCNDDGCFWGGTGSQVTVGGNTMGQCYLIRLAGFFDDDGAEWEDISLLVTCGAFVVPDPPTTGDNTCQTSTMDTFVPCSTDADCPGCVGGPVDGASCEVDGNCRVCVGGPLDGQQCNADGACRVCVGGENNGETCDEDDDCPNACVGGANDGDPCTGPADCPGGACSNIGSCPAGGACPPGGICHNCGLKSRYISITPANPATATSIRVRVLTAPQFPGIIGHVFYAGPEVSVANSPNMALRGAPLQCVGAGTPHSQIWTTGVLHMWGPPAVPTTNMSGITTYGVAHCDVNGDNCSTELNVEMAKWGDVVRPFTGGSQPNFSDVNAIIAKFGNVASAPNTARTDIVGTGNPGQPNTPNQGTNFADVSNDVAAFSGFPYPFTVNVCPP